MPTVKGGIGTRDAPVVACSRRLRNNLSQLRKGPAPLALETVQICTESSPAELNKYVRINEVSRPRVASLKGEVPAEDKRGFCERRAGWARASRTGERSIAYNLHTELARRYEQRILAELRPKA
jgi:hypothetical protein